MKMYFGLARKYQRMSTALLWVAVADPYVGLARKRPKTKWRLQWAENELITYIFAVQVICSILAT